MSTANPENGKVGEITDRSRDLVWKGTRDAKEDGQACELVALPCVSAERRRSPDL